MQTGPYAALLLARAVAAPMTVLRSGLVAFVSFSTDEGYLGDIADTDEAVRIAIVQNPDVIAVVGAVVSLKTVTLTVAVSEPPLPSLMV